MQVETSNGESVEPAEPFHARRMTAESIRWHLAKLNELGLTNEAVGDTALDYASMPDQMGTFTDPPQPGTYVFRLPQDLSAVWESFDFTTASGKQEKRIAAKFDDTHPLIIVSGGDGSHNGEPFQTRISNAERRRGKKEDPTAPFISDMDYVNRDVFGLQKKPGNGSNVAYAQEFSKHGGTEFAADLTWSWFCNDQKDIYVDNGAGGYNKIEGQKGCGQRYYQRDIQKVQNEAGQQVFPLRITCGNPECSANIRAFAGLGNFRKV